MGCVSGVSTAEEEDLIPSIQVMGEGKVETVPDEALASFGVSSENKSLDRAYRENTAKMNAVIRSVKEIGVADKDIQTTSFNVSPVYPQDERGRRMDGAPVGFRVSQQVSVRIRDLAKAGPLIDQVMTDGTNTFSGIQFTSSAIEELRKQAKNLAAKDARANAELLAESLGVKLGKLLKVSADPVRPYYAETRGVAMMAMAGSAGPQIEAGSMAVVATCNVEYTIVQ